MYYKNEHLKNILACHKSCVFSLEHLCSSALEYIQQLESAQPKWISVEERLPEESVTVLVYRDGCCGVARLLDVEPITMWTYTGFGGDPTHWMPLPSTEGIE